MASKAALLFLIIATSLYGQPGRGGGRGRGGMAQPVFTALDTDKDGSVTKNEMKSTFDGWFATWDTAKTGSLTEDQLLNGLLTVFRAPPPGGFNVWGNSQPMVARQADIDAMMAALPTTPGAHPSRPRKVLVLGHTGAF